MLQLVSAVNPALISHNLEKLFNKEAANRRFLGLDEGESRFQYSQERVKETCFWVDVFIDGIEFFENPGNSNEVMSEEIVSVIGGYYC
jgi:hypothetical protein